jgi:hypothetical protein
MSGPRQLMLARADRLALSSGNNCFVLVTAEDRDDLGG